jgi:maltose/moltooligosaccharide transporter
MPNSPTLWFAAGMLWIMDASINVSMEPFRALLDNLPENNAPWGLPCKVFIGIGAYFASKLPLIFTYLGVDTAPLGIIPDSVKYSFYFGGIAFIVTVLWTVITSKEYSPEELAAFEKHKETSLIKETHSADWFASNGKSHLMKGILFLIVSALFSFVIFNFDLKKDLYVLSLGLMVWAD